MKRMKKPLLWMFLLCKRLYKKATFLVIVLLIPLVAFGYSAIDTDDSGIVTVTLAKEQLTDAYADEIIASLQNGGQLIRFVVKETPDEALAAVRAGKADAAWVFADDMRDRVKAFADSPTADNAMVNIYEREDNVALMLAREKLAGELYNRYAPLMYIEYLRSHLPEVASMSDAELLERYDHYYTNDYLDESQKQGLFVFAQDDLGGLKEVSVSTHYLMTPIRGMLGVIVMLCGLATAMYYVVDSKNGTFAWMAQSRRPLAELGCQAVSLANVCAVTVVSLVLIGTATVWWRELAVAVLYVLMTAVFCMMLRRLCRSLRVLGMVIPLLVVIALLVCPVFFDLASLRSLQYLFPPSYFINAVHSDRWLLLMPLHTVVCGAAYWALGKFAKIV